MTRPFHAQTAMPTQTHTDRSDPSAAPAAFETVDVALEETRDFFQVGLKPDGIGITKIMGED